MKYTRFSFDNKKAFDSIRHDLLLLKLAEIHVDPYIIQWIQSYLTNRTQMVVVGREQSSVLPIVSGVPQSSILGPLFIIIFINDVALEISPGSTISLFADDMTLYRPILSDKDYYVLQCDVSAMLTWINANGLSLQSAKW